MIICVCKNVSDKTIIALVKNGMNDISKLQNATGVCLGCGQCVDLVLKLLEQNDNAQYPLTGTRVTQLDVLSNKSKTGGHC